MANVRQSPRPATYRPESVFALADTIAATADRIAALLDIPATLYPTAEETARRAAARILARVNSARIARLDAAR